MKTHLQYKRLMRQTRVRTKIRGTTIRPRLHVFRSNRYTYVQIINDETGKTLAAASAKELPTKGTKGEKAAALGKLIALKAKKQKITKVCFDRGAHKYHGRLRLLAEAARNGGLEL